MKLNYRLFNFSRRKIATCSVQSPPFINIHRGALSQLNCRFHSIAAQATSNQSRSPNDLIPPIDLETNLKLIKYQILLGQPQVELIKQTILECYLNQQHKNFWELLDVCFRLKLPLPPFFFKRILSSMLEAGELHRIENLFKFVIERDYTLGQHLSQHLFHLCIESGSDINLIKFLFNINFQYNLVRQNHQFQQFLTLLGYNHQLLLNSCVNFYQLKFLLNQLNVNPKVPYILDLINLIQQLGIKLDIDSYNLVIKAIAKKNPLLALRFFDSMASANEGSMKPNLQTYLNLMTGIVIDKGDLNKAHNAMNRMPKSLPKYFQRILENVMLNGYMKYRSLPVALDYFNEMKTSVQPDWVTYTTVLTCLAKDERFVGTSLYRSALKSVHDGLEQLGIVIPQLSLNLLFQCYLKVDPEAAEAVAHKIENHVDPPTLHYFSTRINYLIRLTPPDLDSALKYLGYYIDHQYPLNNDLVSDVFSAIKRRRDIVRVERFRELLKRANYQPSIDMLIDQFIIRVNLGLPPLNRKKWRSKFH